MATHGVIAQHAAKEMQQQVFPQTNKPKKFVIFYPFGRICTKFGAAVGFADVVTCDNFLSIGWEVSIL